MKTAIRIAGGLIIFGFSYGAGFHDGWLRGKQDGVNAAIVELDRQGAAINTQR